MTSSAIAASDGGTEMPSERADRRRSVDETHHGFCRMLREDGWRARRHGARK